MYGATRGLIQGFKKGLYLQTNFILKPQCFGEAFELQAYNFISIFLDLEWYKLYEIPGKLYSFLTMLDQSCGVEELIFDLWKFCYDKDCSVHTILQN